MTPDLDQLESLLAKATPGHHPLSTEQSAAQQMADAKAEIMRVLPALIARVRELERVQRKRDDPGSTHWDIAEVGAICHNKCAVAQLRRAQERVRELERAAGHGAERTGTSIMAATALSIVDVIAAEARAAALAMRERCAKACEKIRDRSSGSASECVAAIRALEP